MQTASLSRGSAIVLLRGAASAASKPARIMCGRLRRRNRFPSPERASGWWFVPRSVLSSPTLDDDPLDRLRRAGLI